MSAPTLKQTPEKRTEQLTFSCSFQSLVGLSSAVPIWWDSKLLLNSVAFVLSVLPVLVIIFCDTCFFSFVFDYESCDWCGIFALSNYHCLMWCLDACHPSTEEVKAGGQP